ncbi:MAG TPA: aldehyde dehydrogenase [Clostridiales bacterium]|nr:aldehyde dehydrogenase [Clostridiales bacterium]
MKMLIGGQQADAQSGKTFDNINPYTNQVIESVADGAHEDFEKAGVLAKKAQPAWEALDFFKKAEIFDKFVGLVKENIEAISRTMCAEGGKAISECRGEVECLCVVFDAYKEAARHFYGHTVPLNAEERTVGDLIFTLREAIGVIATVTPFNFPVELYAHKVAPALISGNAVIIKPASDTPKSAYLLTELLHKAGVPVDVAQFVTGSGKVFGSWLSTTKKVDAVSFTGSTPVGMELMRGGANNLQRVFLELGGNDPFVVFSDADLDLAVAEAAGGRCWNSGQTCCANKRFLVENSIKEEFTRRLVEKLKTVTMGDPSNESVMMGPLVSEKAAIQVEDQVAHTIRQGARCILGGKREGAFFPPTVLTEVTPDMDIAKDLEVFAAVFPIIGFDEFEQAVAISNQTCYGLASGVITNDYRKALRYAKAVKAGTCVIGGSGNYRSVHQPFGGYKHSGIGREGTGQTLLEMTQEKSIVIKKIF